MERLEFVLGKFKIIIFDIIFHLSVMELRKSLKKGVITCSSRILNNKLGNQKSLS